MNDLLKLAIEGHGGYSAGILAGAAAVHYPSEYREFGGIMVRPAAGSTSGTPTAPPVLDSVSVAVDITDVTFS